MPDIGRNWDDKAKRREALQKNDIHNIFTHSIALSIGTIFGMALVYFFG